MIEVSLISVGVAKSLFKKSALGLFQEPFWWEIVEQGFSKNCKVALVSDRGQNKVLLPLFFHRIGPVLRVGSPLRGTFTPYVGFIHLMDKIDITIEKDYLNCVIGFLLKKGVHWIEITFTSERDFSNHYMDTLAFKKEKPKTIVLNTNQGKEDLWLNMQGRARNLVRKAEKFGLTVNILDSNVQHIKSFYSMLEKTYKKSGQRPPHSIGFYTLMVNNAISSNNLLFLSIHKDLETVSMGMFLYNSFEMHFISGTSSQNGNKYGANNLMHWEVIKFACNHGIKRYDFGGMGIPAIDKFKKSFGGVEDCYNRYTWMTPSVRFLFKIYMRIRSKFGYIV
tara:strand:+ start:3417 stop:4424 length:1008 start_codon:yes stop_codon:yes gene_type:complete